MFYTNLNNVAMINGHQGIYDGKINNPSVRYARNAVDNYYKTYNPNDFDKFISSDDFPPIDFCMQYAPQKSPFIDKMALIAEAFEEIGKKFSISVQELTTTLKTLWMEPNDNISAQALDINGDGQIDLAEYASSVLLEDMLSSDPNLPQAKNIDGTVNNKGQIAILPYINKANYNDALFVFKKIHETYNLSEAQQEFLKDPNNTIVI